MENAMSTNPKYIGDII